ncbi:hypothetical protein PTKIN_Ptkin02bG0190300 [Pterospermum kingtungense]
MSLFSILVSIKAKLDAIQRRWDTICQLREHDGLGVIDLRLKNRALLNKWLWRFASEKQLLWRSLIVQKYSLEEESLLPDVEKFNKFSRLWKNIVKPLVMIDDMSDVLLSNIGFVLGDGNNISFWNHELVPGIILRYKFPRIYLLACNKEGKVRAFGEFIDSNWRWNIPLRRKVFDWEKVQWSEFVALLENFYICNNLKDNLVWKGNPSGQYSSKSFCLSVLKKQSIIERDWKKVWTRLLPPKIEAFCWQVMHGKVAVKVNLVIKKFISEADSRCAFYGMERESVNHLFFTCSYSWKIWAKWCHGWGVDWVVDIIRMRQLMWTRAKWPEANVSILDFIHCPSGIRIPFNSPKSRPLCVWSKPPVRAVKFNVDGSSIGKPGPTGIGGILRDHDGNELIPFSKSIGVADSNVAELIAIREAFILFLSSLWALSSKLIVESDSMIAVGWVSKPSAVAWKVRNLINHLENLKLKINNWEIVHTYREANQVADSLAKEGVYREIDPVQVVQV